MSKAFLLLTFPWLLSPRVPTAQTSAPGSPGTRQHMPPQSTAADAKSNVPRRAVRSPMDYKLARTNIEGKFPATAVSATLAA